MDIFRSKLEKGKEAVKGKFEKGRKPKHGERPAPATPSPSKGSPPHHTQPSSPSPSKSNKEIISTTVAHSSGVSVPQPPLYLSTVAKSTEAEVTAGQSSIDRPTHPPGQLSSPAHDSDSGPILTSSETLGGHDQAKWTAPDTSQGPLPHSVPESPHPAQIGASSPNPPQPSAQIITSSAPVSAISSSALPPKTENFSQQIPTPQSTPALDDTQPSAESSKLWQNAYERLRAKEEQLVLNYETILKHESKSSSNMDVRLEVSQIVTSQKQKMENSQWTFQWNGKPQKVRDIISRILKITSTASALISVGMTYAPPYVSIPWAAIGALIPLMMSGFDNEEEGISGLEKVAQIISSYRIVEDPFLQSSQAAKDYSEAVIGLYVEVLKYQATAAQFFGEHTLTRFGGSIVGSTDWKSVLASVQYLDNRSRGSILHLGIRAQKEGFDTIKDNFGTLIKKFEDRDQFIKAYLKEFLVRKGDVDQLLTDLSTINYIQDHKDIRKELGSAYFSSGKWFLEDEKVMSWRNWKSDLNVLWLVGSVGVGKSSLTSMLLEDLAKDPSGRLAFFYCSRKASKKDQKSAARDSFENVLRTLLIQLSLTEDGSSITDDLQEVHRRSLRGIKGGALEIEEVISLLRQRLIADSKRRITIVIDALDECVNFTKLLTILKELLHAKGNVRMFITSRFEVEVPSHFGPVEEIIIELQNGPDIVEYVKKEIKVRRQGSGMTKGQATELESILTERHAGMFMWVKLVIEDILDEVEENRLQMPDDIKIKISALKDLKADPDERLKLAYDNVYMRAVGQGQQPARRRVVDVALKLTLCSFRPLTLAELAYATSIQPDGSLQLQQSATILAFCSNFLVEGSAGTIRFAHVSVKQYLERRTPPEYTALEAHIQAAMTCRLFLESPLSQEIRSSTLETAYDANPSQTKNFFTYIRTYWSRHCREAMQTAKIRELEEAVNKQGPVKTEPLSLSQEIDQQIEEASLQNAADNDTGGVSNEEKTRRRIQSGNTALSVVETLVTQFRAPNLRPGKTQNGTSATLHEAVRLDDESAVEFLIATDADLTSRDEFGNSALHEAVRYNRTRTIERLVDAEAPLDARNRNGNTALHFAAFWGFEDVLKALISAGAKPDERNNREETPLHIAVLQSHDDAVRVLLLAGVDVNAKDESGNTPLHYPARVANESIVNLLISSGGTLDLLNERLQYDVNVPKPKRSLYYDVKSKVDQKKRTAAQDKASQNLPSTPSFMFRNLCDYCNLARWLVASPYITTHRHLQSYVDLKSSAIEGCQLCSLFLRELDGLGANAMAERGEPTYLSITLSLAQQSTLSIPSGDILTVTMGGILSVGFELCIDPALRVSPLHEYISGRTVCESSADEPCFEWIHEMRKSCYRNHKTCSLNMSELPTRVIDVGPPDGSKEPVLLVTRGRKGYYAYLSFRWGMDRIPRERITMQETFHKRLRSMPFDLLGQTHWEAVIITRRLGLRYLWIDAHCIIQDSVRDWDRESQSMGDYLTNASFTIVAPGVGWDHGMFSKRTSAEVLLQLECRSGPPLFNSPAGMLFLRRPTKQALEAMSDNALQRGWMLQELVLPQRNLVFSAEQIYWNCQSISGSEGTIVTKRPFLRLKGNDRDGSASGVLNRWYQLLETYSTTINTRPTDRLPALEHMARYVQQQIGSNYCAGLWESDLLRGLLWRPNLITTTCEPFQEYLAPSWSWASFNGPISYSLVLGVDEQNENTSLLNVWIAPKSSLGAIRAGDLKLRAPSRQISKNSIPNGCDYYFDTKEHEDDLRSEGIFFHVLISLWHTDLSDVNARWVGIVLCSTGYLGLEEFQRVGLAIGPDQDAAAGSTLGLSEEGWKTQDFTIV